MTLKFRQKDREFGLQFKNIAERKFFCKIEDRQFTCEIEQISQNQLLLMAKNRAYRIDFVRSAGKIHLSINGQFYIFEEVSEQGRQRRTESHNNLNADDKICAPMPGKILKIFVKEGQQMQANERLFIVEAMKMENEVRAPKAGRVRKINFNENTLVSVGEPVIEMDFF